MNIENSSSKSIISIERTNEAYPSKEMLLRSNQKVLSVKKHHHLIISNNELEKMTDTILNRSSSKSSSKHYS